MVAISANCDNNLALKADGTVVGWGDNMFGQTNIPAGLSNVVAMAAGGEFNLALKADRTVVAWGDNNLGETNIPRGLTNVVAIAAGPCFGLALKSDGTVVGWGYNNIGQATGVTNGAPGAVTIAGRLVTNVVAIAAGTQNSLALKANGTVIGWGDDGDFEISPLAGLTGVVAISSGLGYSLALKNDGTVFGCGFNWYGEATGIVNGYPGTVTINGHALTNVVAIAAEVGSDDNHSLALKADGTVVAWGSDNWYGQDNTGGLTNAVAIAAGDYHSLILTATGGSPGGVGLSFVRADIPTNVVTLLRSCNQNTITQLGLAGSGLYNRGTALSGAKALLAAVLELGMPYTLERDGILHGLLYGNQSLMDNSAAASFLQTQNTQLQVTPTAPPQALTDAGALCYQCFLIRLNQCLTNLQATGKPEIPRLVGHTLRLLNLLSDAYAAPAHSPPPALEVSSASNSPCLLLYGEPYMNYTLQYCDTLGAPGWITTTITNLQDEQTITPPFSGSPRRFYRSVLPMP